MNKIILILTLLIAWLSTSCVSGTVLMLSNDSYQYQFCAYTPQGHELGCANRTNNVTFSRTDIVFKIMESRNDYYNRPLSIFNLLPISVAIIFPVLLLICFGLAISYPIGKFLK